LLLLLLLMIASPGKGDTFILDEQMDGRLNSMKVLINSATILPPPRRLGGIPRRVAVSCQTATLHSCRFVAQLSQSIITPYH